MKKMRMLALVLALVLLLTGCDLMDTLQTALARSYVVNYEDMEYVRPDPDVVLEAMEVCAESAMDEDFAVLEENLYAFSELYNDFYTNYALANIHYCGDLTDIYWTEEYNYCLEVSSQVTAGMDRLLYILADCPHREKLETEEFYGEDFFDDYEGDSLWDDTFTALMEEEAELITRYYDLSAQALEMEDPQECYWAMAELYGEMILLRREIADYAGYESYAHFAYDFYYHRDYTPEQETAYLAQVKEELVPLYRGISSLDLGDIQVYEADEEDTLAYVRSMAKAMGGTVNAAFQRMVDAGLYDISYGENKYGASFEVYLYSYLQPFIFMNPSMSSYDFLTLAHEFGHFCNDFASFGSVAGIDVAEIFSQGMEYLSLFYAEGGEDLEKLKLLDSLCVFVEQSAYAEFERRAYELPEEELTAENLVSLFSQVCNEFGLGDYGVDALFFVQITHFFTNPKYVFSYVVSNDAAMQLYQLELDTPGSGLERLEEHLDSQEGDFLAFLASAEMESPFAPGRLRSIRETFEEILR